MEGLVMVVARVQGRCAGVLGHPMFMLCFVFVLSAGHSCSPCVRGGRLKLGDVWANTLLMTRTACALTSRMLANSRMAAMGVMWVAACDRNANLLHRGRDPLVRSAGGVHVAARPEAPPWQQQRSAGSGAFACRVRVEAIHAATLAGGGGSPLMPRCRASHSGGMWVSGP